MSHFDELMQLRGENNGYGALVRVRALNLGRALGLL